ncbi:hypothetical protein LCGC14_1878000, partial [marine sediment metagenome]
DFQEYSYRVRAYDAVPLYGIFSENGITPPTARDTTPDITDPPAISWITADGANGYSATQNDLSWSEPNDLANDGTTAGSGISGYNIYVSDQGYNANTYATAGDLPTPTFDVTPINGGSLETAISISDTALTPFMWYAYKIVAYDSASTPNASVDSSTVWVRTKKDTQPIGVSSVSATTPAGDPNSDSNVGSTVTISFNGGASKNDTLDLYEIYRAESSSGPWTNKIKIFVAADMAPVTSGLISTVTYNDKDTGTAYNFTDTGLDDNITYYYKIRVVDDITGEAGTPFDSWTDTAASSTTADTTPPAAPSSVAAVDIFKTLAGLNPRVVVTWPHINQPGDFKEYRLYRSTDGDNYSLISSLTTNFYIDDSLSNTDYYYKVTSADTYTHPGSINNETKIGTVSSPINPASIDKVAPVLDTEASSVSETANSATVSPVFDEVAETKVDLGSSCGSYTRTIGTPLTSTTPSITIRNLTPGSTYVYRIVAVDASDNKLTSSCFTLSTPAFSISDDDLSKSVSVSSATLGWTANASADSFIKYTNTKTKETRIVANDEVKGTSAKHSLSLKGLSAGTKYTYTLISKDEYSNRATKAGSFTTDKFKATKVSVSTTVSSAIVTWKTNVKSDSFVEFGKKAVSEDETGARSKTKTHKVVLRNLKPGTKYKFRVASKDANDNVAIKSDSDSSFTTKPFRITSTKKNTSTNSATVTWKTNVASTSSVEYRSATDKVSQLAGDAKLTKTHKVEIKGLEDDTTYSYRIKSRDKEDNIAESKLLSFKTGSLEKEYDVTPKVSDVDEMELSANSAKIAWTTAGETSSWVEYGNSRSLGKNAGNDTMTV